MAEPYQPQLDPRINQPLSGSSPESFGAPFARGLADAGQQIDQAVHTIKQRDRDSEAAAAGVDMARVQTELDKASIDAREIAGPGGAGHEKTITTLADTTIDDALGRIKDKHIRSAFTERYAELRGHIVGREYGWEAGKRADKLATDVDDMGTTLANGQQANPDPVGLMVSLGTVEQTVHALTGISADDKTALIKGQQNKIVVGFANTLQDKNPDQLVKALDQGLLSPYLEKSQLSTLRSGALVEIRRRDAELRQKRDHAKAEAIQTISEGLGKMPDGYVPSDQEFASWHALAKQYDLTGKEWDLGVAEQKGAINRETRTWSPAQWHANIDALEAKGDKRTQPENVRLAQLHDASGPSIARFNADPDAAAAAAGNPPPAVDWETGDGIAGRVTWAKAAARSMGLVNAPLLPNDIAKVYRDRAAQGPAGQLETAATMRSWFGVADATAAVKQIDPNNRNMQLMVGLSDPAAALYRTGDEALKGKTVTLGGTPEDGELMRRVWSEYQAAIPVELQPAVLDAGRSIAAGLAAKSSQSQPTGKDLEGVYRMGIQRAGGLTGTYFNGNNSPGGFANWKGRYAWMPASMTRAEFATRISRADDATWIRAGGGDPYYLGSDGKAVKMTDKQLAHLKDYQLETVNPGVYRLVSPIDGGHVVDATGRPWQIDIRKLGPSFDDQLHAHGYVRK